jgi:DNA-binding MarR family transcriptional regulator
MSAAIHIPPAAAPFTAAMKLGEHVTVRQMAVLHVIAANPGRSTGQIAAALGLSKPVVTRALDVLDKLKLTTRIRDNDDLRRVRCSATLTGQSVAGCSP